jgi:Flp pilus assembly protein TadD
MTAQAISQFTSGGPDLTLASADRLMGLDRPCEALEIYATVARNTPDSAHAFAGLALASLRLNEIEAARDAAEKALALDRGLAKGWFILGAAYNAMGERDNAMRILRHATKLDPNNAEALLVLGYAYEDAHCDADAMNCYTRASIIQPEGAKAHIAMTSLHYVAGRAQEAMASAEIALAIEPENIFALQNMARLLSDAGREVEAKACRNRAYAQRSTMILAAPKPERRVLVLTTTTDGNTPDRYLLPAACYTRLYWFIEYARHADIQNPPPHDVVFNAIADIDLATATSENVARFVASYKRIIINDPRKIALTARDGMADLFAGIEGIEIPKTVRISAEKAVCGIAQAAKQAGIELPFLVRPIGSHGGEGLQLAESSDAAVLTASPKPVDYYLTAFRDYRSLDGYYRKYRMFFVDREPFPYHLAISPKWMVHYITADMAGDESRLSEERRFLENPQAALGADTYRAVVAIGKAMDLDFCGLDFSILPDGKVLVFEANATMLVHPEPEGGPFAHKNEAVARIITAFQSLIAPR